MKARFPPEKTDFICSLASHVDWWLSYDSGSFSYDDDEQLSLISVWCSSDYDTRIPLGLHCSSTSSHRLQLT